MYDPRSMSCLVALLLCGPALAQNTWHVDDDTCPSIGDGSIANPFCSIQDAIVIASDTDEIIVAIGTYFEAIDFLGKAITVRSTDPTDPLVVLATIIDGSTVNAFHVVKCVTNEARPQLVSRRARSFISTTRFQLMRRRSRRISLPQ